MKHIIYFIFICIPSISFAQALRIDEIWNNRNAYLPNRQKQIELSIKNQELKELRSNRIPIIYGDANIQRNLIIPTTPVPAIAFDPSATDGAITPLKFATKWSSKAGIQVEWNIFDPKKLLDEKQKELEINKSSNEIQNSIQTWQSDITLAYASIVLASLQYDHACQDTLNYFEILHVNTARYKAGRLPSSEYLSTQQEYERKLIQWQDAFAVLKEADLEFLKYYPNDSLKHLSSSIDDVLNFIENYKKENFELKSLSIENEINDLQAKSLKRQLLPSLNVNGYIGQQYFSNDFKLTETNSWFGNSNINLSLRIPISSYFNTIPTLKKINLNTQLIQTQIDQNQLLDNISINQKQTKIIALKQKIQRQQKIKDLAAQNKVEMQASYLAGRILLNDYNLALVSYNKAHQDIWQTQYDLIKVLLD